MENNLQVSQSKGVVVYVDRHDTKYVHNFRRFFPGYLFDVEYSLVKMLWSVQNTCKRLSVTQVVCSSQSLLSLLLRAHDTNATGTVTKYAGSVFYIPATEDHPQIRVLILPSPRLLLYSRELPFLVSRWIQKLNNPNFPVFPALDWERLTSENIDRFYDEAKSALLISIDIETKRVPVDPAICTSTKPEFKGIWVYVHRGMSKGKKKYIPVAPVISMVGYSLLLQNPNGTLYSKTGVLPINSMVDIEYMRKFNSLPAEKVMQNGGYDSTYFLRYNAPVFNYVYDTFVAMHSWYAELPRNLAFITSLLDRDYIHWKDEGEHGMAQYNAKDCHNTLWSMVHIIDQWPQWAAENYFENFRMQYPCIQCGAEGFLVDLDERERLRQERVLLVAEAIKRLNKIITPGFNPASPKQVLIALKGLGYKKAKSSDKAAMAEFREAHPLYDIIGELIDSVRKNRKAVSNYFESQLLAGRFLYELNPAATDTGRMNSSASNLWCGGNIQNQPLYAKSQYIADKGYVVCNTDAKQSESRTTAYMSEDENLIEAVESPLDFHRVNASKFFGMVYDKIDNTIRNLGKRVNHGANYNMQEAMLLRTMGRRNVIRAQRLLKLPTTMSLLDVARYLLQCFDKTYPKVRGKFYNEIIYEIQTTGKLVGPTGWTRFCFGNPANSKPELNSYVAHGPQSFSVKIINEAFFAAWRYQIRENKIRLKAQVHDDIIWQCKPEYCTESAEVISKLMSKPYVVRGRTMIIPNDPVTGKQNWKELK